MGTAMRVESAPLPEGYEIVREDDVDLVGADWLVCSFATGQWVASLRVNMKPLRWGSRARRYARPVLRKGEVYF